MRRTALLTAILALSLTTAGVAQAAPPDTDTFTGTSTDVNAFLLTQVSECLILAADINFGTRRSVPDGGYDIDFSLENPCTGERVLQGATPDFEASPGDLQFEKTLTGAEVTLAGRIFSDDPFERIGTYTADLAFAFDTTRFGAGSSNSFVCVPDEEDPETFEPLPGTTYTLFRQHAASGNAMGSLERLSGTLTLTLDSGQTYQFLTPDTEITGGMSHRVGVSQQQVRTAISRDECMRRAGFAF